MRLVKFEFLKIITHRLFFCMAGLFLILNFVFLNYENVRETENRVAYSSYKAVMNDLKGMNMQEKENWIQESYERASVISLIYQIQMSLKSEEEGMREFGRFLMEENRDLYMKYHEEAKNNPQFKYTGELDKELLLLEEIKNGYDQIKNYPQTLSEILAKGDQFQGISIFNAGTQNVSKGIAKTTEAYRNMLDVAVDYQPDKGIAACTKVTVTDFFVLCLVFVLSVILITEEKEKNLFALIKSTKKGRSAAIVSKISALILGTFMIGAVFYGMNLIYYGIMIGLGNLSVPLQSFPMFSLSAIKISAVGYLFLFYASKFLTLILFAVLMFYLCIRCSHILESIFIFFALCMIGFFLQKNIDVNSGISLLSYFNPGWLINTNAVYQSYENLRFLGQTFDKTKILICLQGICVLILIGLSIVKYLRAMNITIKENKLILKMKSFKFLKGFTVSNSFYFELYKQLFVNKAFLIVLLFTFFLIANYSRQNFSLPLGESFYKGYMDILSGDLTYEKEQIIRNAKAEYDQANLELKHIHDLVNDGKMTKTESIFASQPYEDILSTQEEFERIEAKYNYVKEKKQASMVYDTGYNKLFRVSEKKNERDLYLLVVTLLIAVNSFLLEYRTGFNQILNTTVKGRKKTAEEKVISIVLICTFVFLADAISEISTVVRMYGMNHLEASVVSLSAFERLPYQITIFQYMILFFSIRYLSYLFIILFIEFVSLKLKNMIFSFILCLFILMMPFVLNAFNLYEISVFPLMNCSLMVKNSFSLLFIPIMAGAGVFLYNSIIKELE